MKRQQGTRATRARATGARYCPDSLAHTPGREGVAIIDGQIGQALSALLADLVRLVILVVGGYAAAFVRAHYSAAQVQRGQEIGRTAVWAVEQIAAAMGWDSKAKFTRALGFAKRLAARAGLRLDDDQWQAILEAAVRALQQTGAELPKTPPAPPPAPARPALAAVRPTPSRVR